MLKIKHTNLDWRDIIYIKFKSTGGIVSLGELFIKDKYIINLFLMFLVLEYLYMLALAVQKL